MKSPRSPRLPATAQLIRLAVLVVALLGLFGMHGLAAHGTSHAATTAHASGVAAGHGQTEEQDPGDASVVGLCLAVLAAVLLGMGSLRGRGRGRWPRCDSGVRAPTTTSPPAAARPDRDPPCLHSLSILRC